MTIPADQRVVLVSRGDRLIRTDVSPSEIELPWDGVILSQGEHKRLMKIEQQWWVHRVVETEYP